MSHDGGMALCAACWAAADFYQHDWGQALSWTGVSLSFFVDWVVKSK